MIGWLVALPRPARHGLAAAAGALLLWCAWAAWLQGHDESVIETHETEMRANVAETGLKAERLAHRNDASRRAAREARTNALEQARKEATDEHPDETDLVAGPAVRAVLRELRTQARQDRSAAR